MAAMTLSLLRPVAKTVLRTDPAVYATRCVDISVAADVSVCEISLTESFQIHHHPHFAAAFLASLFLFSQNYYHENQQVVAKTLILSHSVVCLCSNII